MDRVSLTTLEQSISRGYCPFGSTEGSLATDLNARRLPQKTRRGDGPSRRLKESNQKSTL